MSLNIRLKNFITQGKDEDLSADTKVCGDFLKEQKLNKMKNKLFNVKAEDIRALKRIMNCNHRILSLYARFLSECPRAVKRELMCELCADGTDKETAYTSVLSYVFDIDEEKESDRGFVRKYLIPSVRQANVSDYLDCEYRSILCGLSVSRGEWSIGEDKYEPYEAFPCGEGVSCADFTEYPRIAFFDREFSFPVVSQSGVEWMSLKPNEIETMREPLTRARGKVTVFGLGLGYFAFCASEKENVESVTVVERDENIIALFEEAILPHLKNRKKIRIVKCDAFEYMERNDHNTDYVFVDIWHDTSDGLPLYIKAKKLEHNFGRATVDYWIENSILQRLRAMVFEEYTDMTAELVEGLPEIFGREALLSILSDRSLRELAKRIELK